MKNLKLLVAASAMILASGCGKKRAVSVNFVNLSGVVAQQFNEAFDFLPDMLSSDYQMFAAAGVGSAAPTSFKVAIYDLSVCEDMTITGSGYSGEKGCQQLFGQTKDQSQYNAGTVPSGVEFLDLMDPVATKAKILAFGAKIPAGTYKYGKINAYRLMKVKGSVTLDNSQGVAYTRADAASVDPTNFNSNKNISAEISGSGPAEEASIVWNQNGFFKFQTPWVFDGKAGVEVDVVFNPDHILKGSAACSNCIIQESEAGTGKGINIPILKLTPVVRKSGEVSQRERYTFASGDLNGDLFIDLYTIKGDANRTIYGVDVRLGYNVARTDSAMMDPFSANEVTVSGNTVTLKDWEANTIASFVRGTESAGSVEGGTATIACSPGVCVSGAGTTPTTISSYSLAVTDLE